MTVVPNTNENETKSGEGHQALRDSREAVSRIWALCARSASNARSTVQIVRNRRKHRPAIYPLLDWKTPLCFCLSLIAISALLLDAPLASFRGHWSLALFGPAEYMTEIGWGGWYIIPWSIVLLVVNLRDWRGHSGRRLLILYNWTCMAFFTLIATGLSGLIVNIAKRSIGRARPQLFPDMGAFSFNPFAIDPYYASFPSGHAATIGSVGGILVLFFPAARHVIIPLAIWIAATRAIVGAHYPSDIVAGLAFGFTATVLTAIVFARLGYIFRQEPFGLPNVKRTFRIFW